MGNSSGRCARTVVRARLPARSTARPDTDWPAPFSVSRTSSGQTATFETASERHVDVVFGKVNTEEQSELAAAFNIRSIPTLMVFRENVILYADAGALPPAMLEEVLTRVKAVDMAEVHREIAARESAGGT